MACPRTPLELFLFLNQPQISSAKKIRLKIMGKFYLLPFKISYYATALVLKVHFEKVPPLAFTTFRQPCAGVRIKFHKFLNKIAACENTEINFYLKRTSEKIKS